MVVNRGATFHARFQDVIMSSARSFITAKLILLALMVLLPLSAADAFVVTYADGEDPGVSVVVLDPGHGGEDSGAIGPRGLMEKDVTLNVALKLAELLREKAGVEVLLTRTDDTFIPLEDRTAFANSSHADIFISIHANATVSRDVKGVETFFLSFEATDDDALSVAEFENTVVGGPEKTDAPVLDDLKEILWDLAKTEAHHESSTLAELIHTSLLKATGKENRGVKQAPFVVLTGAEMPAILVEVGFISNPVEEKWLGSKKRQRQIAESLTSAVMTFKTRIGREVERIGLNRVGNED